MMNTAHVRIGSDTHKTIGKMSRIYRLPMSMIVRIAIDELEKNTATGNQSAAIKLGRRAK
jgi:hypothetical protein